MTTEVIQGDPGTGKTIVAIFLMKLLADISRSSIEDAPDSESQFAGFFVGERGELLAGLRTGLVVPQQSLRESVKQVFRKTPGLATTMVLTRFEVGESRERFDLLTVDEAHRLSRRANQPSGPLNKKFTEINRALFGDDDPSHTQLDWIVAQSAHRVLLLDSAQSVKPADLSATTQQKIISAATREHRLHRLESQMRIMGGVGEKAGAEYVAYIEEVLRDPTAVSPRWFDGYDLRFFDDVGAMKSSIVAQNKEHQLARLVAGYAWPWVSKKDHTAFDIELDGCQLRWNVAPKDWINSPTSDEEVGSIHTVQGYDLNFAGVIIGPDLGFDPITERITFSRENYFDTKGKENNAKLGLRFSDEDLLEYVKNIYRVLLTRGMLGTYVNVCEPNLRERLRPLFCPTT